MSLLERTTSLLLLGAIIGCRTTLEPDTAAPEERSAMSEVMAEDAVLGRERNHDPERMAIAEAVRRYVRGLGAIDYSGCPPDFVDAFAMHRLAWVDLVSALEPFGQMRGEMHDVLDEIDALQDARAAHVRELVAAVWSTWAEVEASLGRHGVETP
jgi:hypothetical protein